MSRSQLETEIAELRACWQDSPHPTVKVTSYFPVYAELFSHLRGTACTFVETGILDGGSLFMWRSWLGPRARIVGIDLNPQARRWEADGFEIHIGDQGDPAFWRDVLQRIGGFDALLDDGGHQSFQQIVTTVEAIRACARRAVVVVEDTAASFLSDFARHGEHSFLEYAKDATDLLTARSRPAYAERFPRDSNPGMVDFFGRVYSIQFFNGIVAFKIDPDWAVVPEIVRNRPPNAASDFRYEGRDGAVVDWPDPFQRRSVTVAGGSVAAAGDEGGGGPRHLLSRWLKGR